MQMRIWRYHLGFCFLLLVSVSARFSAPAWSQPQSASVSLPESVAPPRASTSVDFDDDRVSNPLTVSDREGHPDIEIYFSSTQTVLTLPVDAVAADTGSLAVQELDSDGDEDLLWHDTPLLSPAEVVVWLNDGTGQFTRVLPPGTLPSQPHPGLSLSTELHRSTHPPYVFSLQRTSTSVPVVGSTRTEDRGAGVRYDVFAARPSLSLFFWVPSGRAPPAQCA